MTRSRGCRFGAPLYAPSICREPVLSGEDAAALGVRPWWCRAHGEIFARAKGGPRTRLGIKVEPETNANRLDEHRAGVAERAQARREALADTIAAHVAAAESWPVRRADLRPVLEISPEGSVVTDAVKLAAERGDLFAASTRTVAGTGVPRDLWGYWPSREAFDAVLASGSRSRRAS